MSVNKEMILSLEMQRYDFIKYKIDKGDRVKCGRYVEYCQ